MIRRLSDVKPGELRKLPKNEEVGHEIAAAYCSITSQTLHNKNSKKRGPRSFLRFGIRIYVIADLDAWLKNETEEQKAYA
jgi:hypothetical protein